MTPTSAAREAGAAAGGPYVGLADGVELVGEFTGSGYREPPRLVYRGDGQVVRLTPVLYHLVEAFDRQRTAAATDGYGPAGPDAALADAAASLRRTTGQEFTAAHVAYLCDRKLAPMGVTTYGDGSPPQVTRARPYLSLRFRVAVLPARATWLLGGALMWSFRPAAIAVTLLAALAAEVWTFGSQHPGVALEQTIMTPTGILAVLGLMLASTAFHEIGHATACRYGGVRPGAMGCGIYLVWPAFYTDITDTYRLGRAGRLRADLGGVYFNAIFLTAMALLYAISGYQPLLVAVLMINIEIIQQLLPTLRFDGYYIIADLVGIPDLFTYIGAILKRTVLRRAPDARLTALKRRPQLIVTAWVLIVIPVLLVQLGYLITRLPYLIATDINTIRGLVTTAVHAPEPVLAVAAAAVQTLLLALPVIGVALIGTQLARAGVRVALRRITRRTATPPAAGPRRRPRIALAAAVTVVFAAAAWTLTTRSTPDPEPVAAPTPPPAAAHPTPSRPGAHTDPASPDPGHRTGRHTPSRPYGTRHAPGPHTGAPDTHAAPHTIGRHPAPDTAAPAGPAGAGHSTRDPAARHPQHTTAPHRPARPTPTPSPTRTCEIRLPILPIGIGCH